MESRAQTWITAVSGGSRAVRGFGWPRPRGSRAPRVATMVIAVLPMVLSACKNTDPTVFSATGSSGSGPVSLRRDVQPIFTQNCAVSGCHDAVRTQQLELSSGGLFDPNFGIVGVPSVEAAGVLRVKPGVSDESYLVHKIEGTQKEVGGSGVQMPYSGPPLPAASIDTIRRWIDEGAKNN